MDNQCLGSISEKILGTKYPTIIAHLIFTVTNVFIASIHDGKRVRFCGNV
jgi:hypothetical protein